MATRSFWGWGNDEDALGPDERAALSAIVSARFPGHAAAETPAPKLDAIRLPAPRVGPAPSSLAPILTQDRHARAAHTYGKAFRDIVRGLDGDFGAAPDFVAFPHTERDVVALLDWCSTANLAAIPFGGGSSVVGGTEARDLGDRRGAVSIDLGKLGRLLEVDATSRAARFEAGILGPALEEGLRPHGLTLRHFPQSFEFSTLGGWIATRSGGHFATLTTRIDAMVESVNMVTPSGVLTTRRLPSSGAGPAPEGLALGSEGALGIVTEAWMRVVPRPRFRASATVAFDDFFRGADAARALAQSGLYPSNCRLLDANEALLSGAGDGSSNLLLVAFESDDHALDPWLDRALELAADAGGRVDAGSRRTRADGPGERGGAAGAWRKTFLRAPYMRDGLIQRGLVVETFETATTWARFEAFCRGVGERVVAAAREVAGEPLVSRRVTHVYPDGAAPYFTVIVPGRPGALVAQWDAIKAAASEAIVDLGGTITHHHAVGRDHMPGYRRERSDVFAAAFAASKRALDPAGVMNPGVLV